MLQGGPSVTIQPKAANQNALLYLQSTSYDNKRMSFTTTTDGIFQLRDNEDFVRMEVSSPIGLGLGLGLGLFTWRSAVL